MLSDDGGACGGGGARCSDDDGCAVEACAHHGSPQYHTELLASMLFSSEAAPSLIILSVLWQECSLSLTPVSFYARWVIGCLEPYAQCCVGRPSFLSPIYVHTSSADRRPKSGSATAFCDWIAGHYTSTYFLSQTYVKKEAKSFSNQSRQGQKQSCKAKNNIARP